MVENVTPARGYQEPHGTNQLDTDVLRLIAAVQAIDTDVAALVVNLAAKADSAHQHAQSNITGLETRLNNIDTAIAEISPDVALNDITDVVITSAQQGHFFLRGASGWVNQAPDASLITSGRFAEARMPTYLSSAAIAALASSASLTSGLATKSDTAHGHSNATTSVAGFMSASDKTKLDTHGTNATGTRTVSTSDPSGGADGDIWLKV